MPGTIQPKMRFVVIIKKLKGLVISAIKMAPINHTRLPHFKKRISKMEPVKKKPIPIIIDTSTGAALIVYRLIKGNTNTRISALKPQIIQVFQKRVLKYVLTLCFFSSRYATLKPIIPFTTAVVITAGITRCVYWYSSSSPITSVANDENKPMETKR